MERNKQAAVAAIDQKADVVYRVSDAVWEYAELSLQEEASAALYCKVLEEEGFSVEKGICRIPTGFSAAATAADTTCWAQAPSPPPWA